MLLSKQRHLEVVGTHMAATASTAGPGSGCTLNWRHWSTTATPKSHPHFATSQLHDDLIDDFFAIFYHSKIGRLYFLWLRYERTWCFWTVNGWCFSLLPLFPVWTVEGICRRTWLPRTLPSSWIQGSPQHPLPTIYVYIPCFNNI